MRRLTSPDTARTVYPPHFSPDMLNDHFASISQDPFYEPPPFKCSSTSLTECIISEMSVFKLLDKLKPTSCGGDDLPSWFLRVAAPFFSRPIAHLFTLSLIDSTVPNQWKLAIIKPIPKVSTPTLPSDLRPISVLPVISRTLERLVVSTFLHPAFKKLPQPLTLADQFAYLPTSSTTAALITLLSNITELLLTNSHVYVIIFDYSKAFDTLSHSSVSSKLLKLSIPDCIYNWISFFCQAVPIALHFLV